MSFISTELLADEIMKATHMALMELFSTNEHFYYCSLITTGEALPPFISAWSYEALERFAKDNKYEDHDKELIKWSYAESPYLDFGSSHFDKVRRLFEQRPPMDQTRSEMEWQHEFDCRIEAMETAIRKLDQLGIFGMDEDRDKIVINVEVMPPDYSNTQRAIRLNPLSALSEWLLEAAEPPPNTATKGEN